MAISGFATVCCGVPRITPSDGSRLIPAGRVPAASSHETLPAPASVPSRT